MRSATFSQAPFLRGDWCALRILTERELVESAKEDKGGRPVERWFATSEDARKARKSGKARDLMACRGLSRLMAHPAGAKTACADCLSIGEAGLGATKETIQLSLLKTC